MYPSSYPAVVLGYAVYLYIIIHIQNKGGLHYQCRSLTKLFENSYLQISEGREIADNKLTNFCQQSTCFDLDYYKTHMRNKAPVLYLIYFTSV